MEQTSHSFGQCCIVLLIMTYVRNMPKDIKENYRNQNKQNRKKLWNSVQRWQM